MRKTFLALCLKTFLSPTAGQMCDDKRKNFHVKLHLDKAAKSRGLLHNEKWTTAVHHFNFKDKKVSMVSPKFIGWMAHQFPTTEPEALSLTLCCGNIYFHNIPHCGTLWLSNVCGMQTKKRTTLLADIKMTLCGSLFKRCRKRRQGFVIERS